MSWFDALFLAGIVAPSDLTPRPIAPERVRAGDPRCSELDLMDGTAVVEWTPGDFDWTWTDDEAIYVVRGAAEIELEGGARTILRPGSSAFFPRGACGRVHVSATVREVVRCGPEP